MTSKKDANPYPEKIELKKKLGEQQPETKSPPALPETIYLNINNPEPIRNGDTYKWLYVTEKKIFPDVREIKETLNNPGEPETVRPYILQDENRWQCRKCGAINTFKTKPEVCPSCERPASFDVITDTITDEIENLWKIPRWKPITRENLDMFEVYDNLLKLTKECLIFPEKIHYKLFSLWIIATYHIQEWESVGWLQFLGLHDSGKTRALDLISELGYRMVHGGSGVTFPAMVRASHYYGAGVLMDQAEDKLTKITESGREMLSFVKPSYRRRSKYVVAHKEDQKRTIGYKNFGFKAFATERGLDRALNSRCIIIQMERDYPSVAKLCSKQTELDTIQNQLLNYKFLFSKPKPLENAFSLKGRIRELFEPLITTSIHIGQKADDVIKFAEQMEKEKDAELEDSNEWIILACIKKEIENEFIDDAPEIISYEKICNEIGWDYDNKTSQRLGYTFRKKLQLETKKMNYGAVLLTTGKNERRLKYLFGRFKL